ncbi:hypothetical protein J2S04_002078 [Alicyclobacillus tengchongensis]|uniref:Uncharacterized protein n=1 Tax=Alicyclobacillus tolerans TaxID=90970 RepID=A0ABT9LXX2_9BACL|nr:hypothetical protein [Alicyclobacillus tengchongensis]
MLQSVDDVFRLIDERSKDAKITIQVVDYPNGVRDVIGAIE